MFCFIVQTKIQKRMTCISIGLSSLEGIAKLTVNESQEEWGRFLPTGKLMTATFITVTSNCKSTQAGLENIAHNTVYGNWFIFVFVQCMHVLIIRNLYCPKLITKIP